MADKVSVPKYEQIDLITHFKECKVTKIEQVLIYLILLTVTFNSSSSYILANKLQVPTILNMQAQIFWVWHLFLQSCTAHVENHHSECTLQKLEEHLDAIDNERERTIELIKRMKRYDGLRGAPDFYSTVKLRFTVNPILRVTCPTIYYLIKKLSAWSSANYIQKQSFRFYSQHHASMFFKPCLGPFSELVRVTSPNRVQFVAL